MAVLRATGFESQDDMEIRLPLSDIYQRFPHGDPEKNPQEVQGPWITPGQDQEWEIIQSDSFLQAIKAIRRNCRIDVGEARWLYNQAFGGRISPGRSGVRMPQDEAPRFAGQRPRRRTDPVSLWRQYSDKLKPKDIQELRQAGNLSQDWDQTLREIVLLGHVMALPFRGCAVRLDRSQKRTRLVIDVFKGMSIADIPKYWNFVKNYREFNTHARQSHKLALDTSSVGKIMIVVGQDATRDQVKKLWPKIKKLQQALPGRERFRVKENFGRDKIAAKKRSSRMSAVQIQQEMPKMLRGKPFNSPEAVRVAVRRCRQRTRSK